jgi:hypothetical protein
MVNFCAETDSADQSLPYTFQKERPLTESHMLQSAHGIKKIFQTIEFLKELFGSHNFLKIYFGQFCSSTRHFFSTKNSF